VKIENLDFLRFSKVVFLNSATFPEESWTTKVYSDLPLTESVVRFVAFFDFDFTSVFEKVLF
jgi:hypothetical protein